MLKNFHSMATDDCIVGIAIVGIPEKNPALVAMT